MKTVAEAQAELNEYLAKNPHLVESQRKIEAALDKAETPAQRLQVIGLMLNESVHQMKVECQMLQNSLKKMLQIFK